MNGGCIVSSFISFFLGMLYFIIHTRTHSHTHTDTRADTLKHTGTSKRIFCLKKNCNERSDHFFKLKKILKKFRRQFGQLYRGKRVRRMAKNTFRGGNQKAGKKGTSWAGKAECWQQVKRKIGASIECALHFSLLVQFGCNYSWLRCGC
jgi:hypothetical protein